MPNNEAQFLLDIFGNTLVMRIQKLSRFQIREHLFSEHDPADAEFISSDRSVESAFEPFEHSRIV
jgi:hypothetical protein